MICGCSLHQQSPLQYLVKCVYLSLPTNKRQITCNLFLKTFQHYLIFTTNANVYLPKLWKRLMKMAFRMTDIFFMHSCISIICIISGAGTRKVNAKIEYKGIKNWWETLSIVNFCPDVIICNNCSDLQNLALC